jgi:putative nucleotidyltransferase with HDIG domain
MPPITLTEIIRKVDRLPELPAVALRVSRMLEEQQSNAEMLAQVIRMDSALTSQVLKLCNSAAYGFSRRISTVKDAVAILGFATLKSMVYVIMAKVTLDQSVPGYSLVDGELWYNSLTCAVYAKHIAQRERMQDPEQAFTGALLRDIGKVVLGEFLGPNYSLVQQLTLKERIDFLTAEERVIGFNHCTVGVRIAEKWNLPPVLVNAIRYHHNIAQLPPIISPLEAKNIGIIHLADAFTRMIGQGNGSDGLMYCLDIDTLNRLGIPVQGNYLERKMEELMMLGPVIQDMVNSLNNV